MFYSTIKSDVQIRYYDRLGFGNVRKKEINKKSKQKKNYEKEAEWIPEMDEKSAKGKSSS